MMERLCCVASTGDESKAKEKIEKKNYILPNSTNITLQEERILAPEILFKPKLLGGITELINSRRTISSCFINYVSEYGGAKLLK